MNHQPSSGVGSKMIDYTANRATASRRYIHPLDTIYHYMDAATATYGPTQEVIANVLHLLNRIKENVRKYTGEGVFAASVMYCPLCNSRRDPLIPDYGICNCCARTFAFWGAYLGAGLAEALTKPLTILPQMRFIFPKGAGVPQMFGKPLHQRMLRGLEGVDAVQLLERLAPEAIKELIRQRRLQLLVIEGTVDLFELDQKVNILGPGALKFYPALTKGKYTGGSTFWAPGEAGMLAFLYKHAEEQMQEIRKANNRRRENRKIRPAQARKRMEMREALATAMRLKGTAALLTEYTYEDRGLANGMPHHITMDPEIHPTVPNLETLPNPNVPLRGLALVGLYKAIMQYHNALHILLGVEPSGEFAEPHRFAESSLGVFTAGGHQQSGFYWEAHKHLKAAIGGADATEILLGKDCRDLFAYRAKETTVTLESISDEHGFRGDRVWIRNFFLKAECEHIYPASENDIRTMKGIRKQLVPKAG